MKKLFAALMCFCMMSGLLYGCGKTNESVSDVVTVIEEDELVQNETNEQLVEEEPTSSTDNEDPTSKEAYAFYAFMNGDGVVVDERGKDIFAKDTSYTFQAMTEAVHEYVINEFNIPYLGDISYSFIDCGADGKQELALKFEFCENKNQAYGNFIEYLIISVENDKYNVIYDDYTYYRTETIISDTGYIKRGGSDSAVSHTYDSYYVNDKGEEVFLYTETYMLGLQSPIIPSSYLADSEIMENYVESEFSDELAYSVTIYNCSEISVDDMLDDGKYETYKKKNFFVITDPDGNDATDYDSEMYKQMDVEIISYTDALARIENNEANRGVTPAIKEGRDIIWYGYDKLAAFSEYKYEHADAIDKTAVEDQLKLIAANQSVWRNDISDRRNSYVYYAVTDLDMNGRLEVIRCDYCYLPEFCKNRFYEVTPDFKSIRKMDYDVETMWANGEESGSSHGLLNAQLPVYCFWNSDWGTNSADYTGTSYYYIIPTREVHDEYESVVKMALCANNSGKIFTDFVGYANMNNQTGEVTHMDYNGFEATEEEFAKAEFNAYSADTGWQCDKVNWLFVNLESNDDVYEVLSDSYNHYSHETTIRLY